MDGQQTARLFYLSCLFYSHTCHWMESESYRWSCYTIRSCTDNLVLVAKKRDYGDNRPHYDQSTISIYDPWKGGLSTEPETVCVTAH